MANKNDLINHVVEETSMTKKDAEAAVNAVFGGIQSFLEKRDTVKILGFGAFEVRDRASRQGRNPQTGEDLQIPATTIPAFKAGKGLKDAIKALNS